MIQAKPTTPENTIACRSCKKFFEIKKPEALPQLSKVKCPNCGKEGTMFFLNRVGQEVVTK